MSTCRSKRPSAVSALRGVAAFSFPSRAKSSAAVGKELVPATETTGVPGARRAARVRIVVAGPLVQGEQHARDRRGAGAVRGERADDQVGAVAGGDDQAARGQRVQEVRQHRAAEDEVQRVAGEPRVVAEEHLAAEGVGDLGDGRRGERGLVGQDVAGHGEAGRRAARRSPSRSSRGDPVDDHGEDVAAEAVVRAVRVAGLGAHGLGGLVPAADDRDARTAPNSLASRALSASSSGNWVSAKSVPRTRTTS